MATAVRPQVEDDPLKAAWQRAQSSVPAPSAQPFDDPLEAAWHAAQPKPAAPRNTAGGDLTIFGADGKPLPADQQPRRSSDAQPPLRRPKVGPVLAPRDVTATTADAPGTGLAGVLREKSRSLPSRLVGAGAEMASNLVQGAVEHPLETANAMVNPVEAARRGYEAGKGLQEGTRSAGSVALEGAMYALPAVPQLRVGGRAMARVVRGTTEAADLAAGAPKVTPRVGPPEAIPEHPIGSSGDPLAEAWAAARAPGEVRGGTGGTATPPSAVASSPGDVSPSVDSRTLRMVGAEAAPAGGTRSRSTERSSSPVAPASAGESSATSASVPRGTARTSGETVGAAGSDIASTEGSSDVSRKQNSVERGTSTVGPKKPDTGFWPPETEEKAQKLWTARTPSGRLPANLTKIPNEALTAEYAQLIRAHQPDADLAAGGKRLYGSLDYADTRSSEPHTGDVGMVHTDASAKAAGRTTQRIKAIERVEAEITRRGLDPFEYLHSGIGLEPSVRQRIADVFKSALSDPFPALRRSDPEFAGAADAAIASRNRAGIFARTEAPAADEGLSAQEATDLSKLQIVNRLKNITPSKSEPTGAAAMREATIAKYEKDLPPDLLDRPHVQDALARRQALYKETVEPEAIAGNVPEDIFSDSPTGHIKLLPTAKAGETAPQAAANIGARQVGATKTARAAQPAAGTGLDYETDYRKLLEHDARDKFTAAATNRLYRMAADRGQELAPGDPVPEGMTRVTIRDPADIIDDPQGRKFTVALPKEAAQAILHVQKELSRVGPTTPAGEFAEKASNIGGRAVLALNPGALVSHSRNLAAQLASIPEPGVKGAAKAFSSLVPGAKQVRGFTEMLATDMKTSAAKAAKATLAEYGALRPVEQGLSKVEEALERAGQKTGITVFGNEGLDETARVGMALKYLQWKPDAPPYEVARFVSRIAGNYTRGLGGAMVDWLQTNRLAMFARIETAKLGLGARTLVGQSGIPVKGVGPKVEMFAKQLMQGPIGTRLGQAGVAAVLGEVLGRKLAKNAPGHESDVPVGSKDKEGRDLYVRGKFLNPTDAAATEDLGVDAAMRGDWLGFRRALENTALRAGGSHPFVKGAAALAGKETQVDREGNLYSVGHPTVSGRPDPKDVARALVSMTSAAPLVRPRVGNPGMPEPVSRALSFVGANVTAAAKPGAAITMERGDIKRVLSDRESQIFQEKDPVQRQSIVKAAQQEFRDAGIATDPEVLKGIARLRRALNRAQVSRPQQPVRRGPTP